MPALFVAPAAATCGLLISERLPSVIHHPAWVRYADPPVLPVFLMLYMVALFLTCLIGIPVWLALHSYKVSHCAVFIAVGALIGAVAFGLGSPLLSIYIACPALLPLIASGALGGWVLHRIAYHRAPP
jgi:hypothetical protein